MHGNRGAYLAFLSSRRIIQLGVRAITPEARCVAALFDRHEIGCADAYFESQLFQIFNLCRKKAAQGRPHFLKIPLYPTNSLPRRRNSRVASVSLTVLS